MHQLTGANQPPTVTIHRFTRRAACGLIAGGVLAPLVGSRTGSDWASPRIATAQGAVPAPLPSGRAGAGIAAIGSTIYLFGGIAGSGRGLIGSVPDTTPLAYDATANTWTTRQPRSLSSLEVKATAGDDGRIYAQANDRPYLHIYDPATDQWSQSAPDPSLPAQATLYKTAQATITSNGRILLVMDDSVPPPPGGLPGPTRSRIVEYDPASDTFTNRASFEIGTGFTSAHVTAGPGDQLLLLRTSSASRTSQSKTGSDTTLATLDPLTGAIEPRAPMPVSRGATGIVSSNGKLYVFGGGKTGVDHTNDADVYDSQSDTWTALTPMPTARSTPSVAATANGSIYVVAGLSSAQPTREVPLPHIFASRAVERYDPATDSWTSSGEGT